MKEFYFFGADHKAVYVAVPLEFTNTVHAIRRLFFVVLLALVASPIFADATGQGAIVTNGCMEDLAGFGLNCTANDVRVSGVADVTGDGVVDEDDITFAPICDATADNPGADCSSDANVCQLDGSNAPQLCGDRCAFPGDTTTFSATFIFDLSTQERHDVAGYFEVSPDLAGDGALTGNCAIVTLPETGTFTRPASAGGGTASFVDLDTTCTGKNCPQPGDLCGDINEASDPIYYDMKGPKASADMIQAVCVDTSGNGRLNLPTCTSWRQPGANEVCLDGNDTAPGSPSKCNCDPDFEVPINVPPATITVDKSASPTMVNEPGGTVKFDVSVTNDSLFANMSIDTLSDDIYGNITTTAGDITSTTCSVPQSLGPGATYSCYFMATVNGQGDTSHTDTVTASGMDENGNPVSGNDDATVDIVDVLPSMTVDKSCTDPNPCERLEPGGSFTFQAQVNNTSTADVITLTAMTDDIYGNITVVAGNIQSTTCTLPQNIALGGSYTCSFVVNEMQSVVPWDQTDTITFTASDEEGNPLEMTDSAIIRILDVPSMIEVTKSANPTTVPEPGADVTYTFEIDNLSTVDTVFIDSLIDTIYGDLSGEGDCGTITSGSPVELAPGGSFSCEITELVSGNAGDSILNEVTASGTDDDGNAVSDMSDATVNITDVAPAASVIKGVQELAVTFTVRVDNDSAAESLTLEVLSDDQFGDVTDENQPKIIMTDCEVPQVIAIGGNYQCTFVGVVTSSPHVNEVTATVSDDDGNEIMPSDTATVSFEQD